MWNLESQWATEVSHLGRTLSHLLYSYIRSDWTLFEWSLTRNETRMSCSWDEALKWHSMLLLADYTSRSISTTLLSRTAAARSRFWFIQLRLFYPICDRWSFEILRISKSHSRAAWVSRRHPFSDRRKTCASIDQRVTWCALQDRKLDCFRLPRKESR